MKKRLLIAFLTFALLISLFAACSVSPAYEAMIAPTETEPDTLSEEGDSEESTQSNALRFGEGHSVALEIAREIDLEERLAAVELLPLEDGYLLYARLTEDSASGDPKACKLTLDADFQILSEKSLGESEPLPVKTFPSASGEGYRLCYLLSVAEETEDEESSESAVTLYKGSEELFSIPYPEGGFDEVYLLEAPEGVYIINSAYLLLNGEPLTIPKTETGGALHGQYFLTMGGNNFAVFSEINGGAPGDAYIAPISDGKFGQVVRFDSAADVAFMDADEDYAYYGAENRLYRTDGTTLSECNYPLSFGIPDENVLSFFVRDERLIILTENKILVVKETTL